MKIDSHAWSFKLVAGALAIGLAGALCAANAVAATTADVYGWLASTARIARIKPPSHSQFPGTYIHIVAGADVRGFVDPGAARVGFLRDGREVMLVPVDSGGSGGVFAALVFTRTPDGRARFVDLIPPSGDHLEVSIAAGRIRVRTPIYKSADPNCCPSSFHYELYTLRDWTLVKLESWTSARH